MNSTHKNKYLRTEIILISLMWLVLLASPWLFRDEESTFTWSDFARAMETIIPIFIVFIVNRFFLVPYYFAKKKRIIYFVSVGILVFLTTTAFWFYHSQTHRQANFPPQMARPFRDTPPAGRSGHRPPPVRPNPQGMPPFANVFVLSILLVGFDTGLKTSMRGFELEQEKEILEKQNMANQLDMLRHQVSPHFFMNTLNNIHTLIEMNTQDAQSAVIKLSKLMRYLLYETDEGNTTISREIEFIESYIELMKLRVSDKVDIVIHISENIPDKKIPPLLFTSFIENAFKHGVSYQQESYIHLDMMVNTERLVFQLKNSKAKKSSNLENKNGGIGLENTIKRLDLLYANSYHLDILEDEKTYSVNLSIPI